MLIFAEAIAGARFDPGLTVAIRDGVVVLAEAGRDRPVAVAYGPINKGDMVTVTMDGRAFAHR
jgi:hypothetical protein